ncbi:MAG: class I SAM-dependent methyltransferase [Acidimicrobiales bacterium]
MKIDTPRGRGTGPRGFDGAGARLVAPLMARLNRDMELAALDELEPEPNDRVLCIGFGPGVGVAALTERLVEGTVCGIDPSAAMGETALRHNARAVESGRVVLRRAAAESIPWSADTFDAVVAVNCIQLWRPLQAGVSEVARVLRAGGPLVALTHVWAIEKLDPIERWSETLERACAGFGIHVVTSTIRRFRSGPGLVVRAERETRV